MKVKRNSKGLVIICSLILLMDLLPFGTESKAEASDAEVIEISKADDLVKIGKDPSFPLDGSYVLTRNIDLSEYNKWEPIGGNGTPFAGKLDGGGHTVRNLHIDKMAGIGGLFGVCRNSIIQDLHLKDVNISAGTYVGGLIGKNTGMIDHVSVDGKIAGFNDVGGLVGWQSGNEIRHSASNTRITATERVGGLVGRLSDSGVVTQSFATGNISVKKTDGGGLIGQIDHGTVSDVYAMGYIDVSGGNTGGLIGSSINESTVKNAYYDATTSGQGDTGKGESKTTKEMKQLVTYPGWDFYKTWFMVEGETYPLLKKTPSLNPVIALENKDGQQITTGDPVPIRGTLSNLQVGDTAYVQVAITDDSGQTLPDDHYQLLQKIDVSDTEMSVDSKITADIDPGTYTVHVRAKTIHTTGESKEITLPLTVNPLPVKFSSHLTIENTDGSSVTYQPKTWTNRSVTIAVDFNNDIANKRQYAVVKNGDKPADSDWNAYTEPVKMTDDGKRTVYLRTIDTVGHLMQEKVEGIWIDRAAPEAPTMTLDHTSWTNQPVTLTIADGPDTLSGPAKTEYKIGADGKWQIYDSPFTINDAGERMIFARTVDKAGNMTEKKNYATANVKIDTQAPNLQLIGDNPMILSVFQGFIDPGYTAVDDYNGDLSDWVEVLDNINKSIVGEYDVTYAVTDKAGNTTTVQRHVHVVDGQEPEITLKGGNPLILEVGRGDYMDPGATATDNYDDDLTNQIKVDTSHVNTTKVGRYHVTYIVTDRSGNTTMGKRIVEVVDTTQPAISLNGGKSLTLYEGEVYKDPGYSVSDNSGEEITGKVQVSGKVNTDQAGVYEIVYTVSDRSGNRTTKRRSVKVVGIKTLTIKGEPQIMETGASKSLKVTAVYRDGHRMDVTNQTVYQTDNPSAMSIDKDGQLHAIKARVRPVTVSVSFKSGKDRFSFRIVDQIVKPGRTASIKAGQQISVDGTNTLLQLPEDLPDGTKMTIYRVNPRVTALQIAGDVFRFKMIFPVGYEDYTGDYQLSLGKNEIETANNPRIYYYNDNNEQWEYVGGTVEKGVIKANVRHFSTYGVFTDTKGPSDLRLSLKEQSEDHLSLEFSASDPSGIAKYQLLRDGELISINKEDQRTVIDKNLKSAHSYVYTLVAVDRFGHRTEKRFQIRTKAVQSPPSVSVDDRSPSNDSIHNNNNENNPGTVGDQPLTNESVRTVSLSPPVEKVIKTGGSKGQGGILPDTSSGLHNWLAIGFAFILISVCLFLYQYRRKIRRT